MRTPGGSVEEQKSPRHGNYVKRNDKMGSSKNSQKLGLTPNSAYLFNKVYVVSQLAKSIISPRDIL